MAGVNLAIVFAACGRSMTADEYVADLNALASKANALFEPAVAAYGQIPEPTVADEVAFLEQEIPIRRELVAPLDALDPPEFLRDVHELLRDFSARQLAAAEALAPVAETVSNRDELLLTPEFAEHESVNANGSRACLDVQARLDALADSSEALADEPWLSGLGLVVRSAMGCSEVGID